MKIGDLVYVVDWGKHYSDITKWNQDSQKRESIFPIKTELPDYCGIDHHWKFVYEPNLTLKGTVNKREPRKLKEKIPEYKNYKWEVLEIFKHPKAGQFYYNEEQRERWKDYDKYTENDLVLLASTHTDKDWMKCYIVIEDTGVSFLTPQQFADEQFNAMIEANLGKWDKESVGKFGKNPPDEIVSSFFDRNDNVLFGSSMVKGKVEYRYLEGKFSKDGKPIYLGCSISYDGKGNEGVEDKSRIKSFQYIKDYVEGKEINTDTKVLVVYPDSKTMEDNYKTL